VPKRNALQWPTTGEHKTGKVLVWVSVRLHSADNGDRQAVRLFNGCGVGVENLELLKVFIYKALIETFIFGKRGFCQFRACGFCFLKL